MAGASAGKFCPYCGATNDSEYRFCLQCRRPLPADSPETVAAPVAPAPTTGSTGSLPGRRSRRRWMAVSVVLVLGIALAVAFLVPIPMTFSLTIASHGLNASTTDRSFPAHSVVSFHWNTSNGASVTFSLVNSQGTTLAQSSGQGGNCTFTADGNSYGFVSSSVLFERVSVTGNFAAPLLP